MEKFTKHQIEEMKKENEKLYSLLAPKPITFLSAEFTYNKGSEKSIIIKGKQFERKFDAFIKKLEAMPTNEDERFKRKQMLIKYRDENLKEFVKVCDAETMEGHEEDFAKWLKEWDEYDVNLPANCKRQSINELETALSNTPSDRSQLRELYQSYIGRLKGEKATDYSSIQNDFKEYFSDCTESDIKSIIEEKIRPKGRDLILWNGSKADAIRFTDHFKIEKAKFNKIFRFTDGTPLHRKHKDKTGTPSQINEILQKYPI